MSNEPEKHEMDFMKDVFCEACKGMSGMEYTDCYKDCDGFKKELDRAQKEGEI